MHPLQFGYCFIEGWAVSVEGKDALFLRAECILYSLDTVLSRVSSIFEGKDALFMRAGVHPLQFGYCFYEGWAVSVEGKDALFMRAECILYSLDTAFMRVGQYPLRGRVHSL